MPPKAISLHVDIETYCDLDLKSVGVHKYAGHPSFEVLLVWYALDDGEVRVIEPRRDVGELESLRELLADPRVIARAHNAGFEITCLSALLGMKLDPARWSCTMAGASYLGLPASLDAVAQVLGLAEKKDARGKALINYFSRPCKPTAANGGRTRNLPGDDPARWETFRDYCAQDVRVERELQRYLDRYPRPPAWERANWIIDQRVNAVGIAVDTELAREAVRVNNALVEAARSRITAIAGIDNPGSYKQLGDWLRANGVEMSSLDKEAVETALAMGDLPPACREVLALHASTSNTSVSKYDAMLERVQPDGRVRGLLQFYGASRTGRFAGRGIQVQNLKRTIKDDAESRMAREACRHGFLYLVTDDVGGTVSRLTRTALVASPGMMLVVSDFSSIEARVLAWIAGEEWALEVFRGDGKIYEATAANMFRVPVESVTKGSDLRAKGKIAVLALGYQGGSGALVSAGALREGLAEQELPRLVNEWRAANKKIVRLWGEVERSAKVAARDRSRVTLELPYCRLAFDATSGDYLFIELPSGRLLSYPSPSLARGRLTYKGVKQGSVAWRDIDTYGGALVENVTQAVARDLLCHALRLAVEAGLTVLTHVHDEIICEAPAGEATATLEKLEALMTSGPGWARGLPLGASGYVNEFYKKD